MSQEQHDDGRLTAEPCIQADGERGVIIIESSKERKGSHRLVDNLPGIHLDND